MALNAKTDPNYVPKRINGKFAPGWSGNPGGSLEATRRSFNKDFLLALAADFKKHGAAAIAGDSDASPAEAIKSSCPETTTKRGSAQTTHPAAKTANRATTEAATPKPTATKASNKGRIGSDFPY